MINQFNEEMRYRFIALGTGGQYSETQKKYAFELIDEHGMRATARILRISRRTLQRWCRQYGIYVKRCPYWVYGWAERRRKKREFWQRRGYF
jgi:transposase-like protein